MNNEQIRISAKTLGHLFSMPDSCPRCAWIKLNCDLPYQIFPGIFSSIDSYTKKITWSYHERDGVLPNWFKGFGEFTRPVKAPGRSQFTFTDKETNGLLLRYCCDSVTIISRYLTVINRLLTNTYKSQQRTENPCVGGSWY